MVQVPAVSGPDARRWLVTGASRGIGHAVATPAASRGERVCIVGRYTGTSGRAAGMGGERFGISADVTKPEDVSRIASDVAERRGGGERAGRPLGADAPEAKRGGV